LHYNGEKRKVNEKNNIFEIFIQKTFLIVDFSNKSSRKSLPGRGGLRLYGRIRDRLSRHNEAVS
jgi:hypothetical protein